MNVIGIRYIIPVGYARYNAESLLEALSKLIRRAFKRSTIKREIYVFLLLPLFAGFGCLLGKNESGRGVILS